MQTIKTAENEIKVIKTEEVIKENFYTFEYLTKQRETIVAQRDAELAEVDALLGECNRLGVRAKEVGETNTVI